MQEQGKSVISNPFRTLTFLMIMLLLLPVLMRDGMFMDGIQYACVSKNLAIGKSTFWEPYLGPTWNKNGNPSFLEHPPLVYGIQAGFFKILGNSRFTERVYCLTMALLSGLLLALTWRLIQKRSLDWFPVLLWFLIPVVFWSYQNNLQENTMGVFTLGAIYFVLKSAITSGYHRILFAFLAGCAVFCASLSKGIPGLFPLAAPLLLWISTRKIRFLPAFMISILILSVVILMYITVLQDPKAYQNMKFWLLNRVFSRMDHDPTTSYRLDSLWRAFTELLPSIALALIVVLSTRKEKKKEDTVNQSYRWFFLLVGLSATLPLMLSMVQKGFYLVPAFPFFALAIALVAAPSADVLQTRILQSMRSRKILISTNFIILIGTLVLTISRINEPHREENTLHDVYQLGTLIPGESTIRTDEATYDDWAFQLYLLRYFDISFNPSDTANAYYLRAVPKDISLEGYQVVDLPLRQHILYKKATN